MRKNYLLFMPSLMSDRSSNLRYAAPDDNTVIYEGMQTNVPATKYILDRLSKDGQKLTQIVMLCSREVTENVLEKIDQTSLNYYCQTISDWMKCRGYTDDEVNTMFSFVSLGNNAIRNKSDADRIIDAIANTLPNDGNLYLDITGGMRSAAVLMVFLCRFLEKRGMTVQDVVYSNIFKNPELEEAGVTGKIESCTGIYKKFEWLDSATKAELGDLEALKSLAEREGFEEIVEAATSTAIAVQKSRSGQYAAITKAEIAETSVTDHLSVTKSIVHSAINTARKDADPKNAVKSNLKNQNITAAANYIRENGLDMLIKKGAICWKSQRFVNTKENDKVKPRENAFYAYINYYESYLRYIQNFLNQVPEKITGAALLEQFEAFSEEQSILKLNSAKKVSTSPFLEREFKTRNKKVIECLENELCLSVSTNCSVENILKSYEEYAQSKYAYMAAYYNTGFPFACNYGNYSYSQCGKYWLSDVFMCALEKTLEEIHLRSPDELSILLAELRKSECIKMLWFSPPEVYTLFSINKEKIKPEAFGEKLVLMNDIRLVRNTLTHKPDASEGVLKKNAELAMEFAQWLDTL